MFCEIFNAAFTYHLVCNEYLLYGFLLIHHSNSLAMLVNLAVQHFVADVLPHGKGWLVKFI